MLRLRPGPRLDTEGPGPDLGPAAAPHPDGAGVVDVPGSGTGPRFVLLLVLVAASTVAMTPDHIVLRLVLGDPDNDLLGCMLAAGMDPAGGWPTNSVALTGRNATALRTCAAPYGPAWWSGVAVVGAVFALGAALCWVMPWWRIRRRGLCPLLASSPEHAALAASAARAGLPSARFAANWASTSTNAVAFGRPGRAYVALPAGLLQTRSSHPERFAASVLHELAHLRYRDVGLTYATVALWRVFAVTILLPYLARMLQLLVQGQFLRADSYADVALVSEGPDQLRKLTLCLFTAVLVYLSRSDILRTREFHADRQAVDWGADPAVWDAAARTAAAARGVRGVRATLRSALSALLAEHPGWAQRAQALRDPEMLLRAPAVPTFLTGAAAAMIGGHLEYVPGLPAGTSVQVAGTALAGALVAGTTVPTLWRRTARALAAGCDGPSGARAGLWLGAGLVAGSLIGDLRLEQVDWLPATPWSILVLALLALVVTCWTTQCARLFLADLPTRLTPVATTVGLAATGALFAFGLSWWESTRYLFLPDVLATVRDGARDAYGAGDAGSPVVRTVAVVAVGMLTLGTLISWLSALLWLVPLLAWAGPASGAPAPRRPSLRRTLGGGVTAGLASLLLAVVATLVFVRLVEMRGADEAVLLLGVVTAALLVGPLGAAALGAALARRGTGLLVGTIVGGVALAVCAAGLTLVSFGLHCVPGTSCGSHDSLWPVVSPVVLLLLGPATDVAAVLALLVSGLVAPIRARRRRPSGPPESPAPERAPSAVLARRRMTVAATVALVVGLNLVLSILPSPLIEDTPATRSTAVAPVATTPKVRGAQLIAWARYGGGRLTTTLPDSLQQIVDGTRRLGAGDQAGVAAVRSGCTGVVAWAADAGAYFTVPDPDHQVAWERAQSLARGGGTDCLAALDARDGDALTGAIGRIDDAVVLVTAVITWITTQMH